MDIREAQELVHNKFSEEVDSEWWNRSNEETYQELLNILEPYMRLDLAVDVLRAAFWAAADEYGG